MSAAGSHRQAVSLSLISRLPPEVLPEVSRAFRKLGLKYVGYIETLSICKLESISKIICQKKIHLNISFLVCLHLRRT